MQQDICTQLGMLHVLSLSFNIKTCFVKVSNVVFKPKTTKSELTKIKYHSCVDVMFQLHQSLICSCLNAFPVYF